MRLRLELAADRDPTVRCNIGAGLAVLDAETIARAADLRTTQDELQQDPRRGETATTQTRVPPGATP